MSIFLEVTIKTLVTFLSDIIRHSENADNSWKNSLLSPFGLNRDPALAKRKREFVQDLQLVISKFDSKRADNNIALELKQLVTDTKSQIDTASEAKFLSSGLTGAGLLTAINIINAIQLKLESHNLLGVRYTGNKECIEYEAGRFFAAEFNNEDKEKNSPFVIFQHAIASYLAAVILHQQEISLLEQFIKHPKISSSSVLNIELEEKIKEVMNNCQSYLLPIQDASKVLPQIIVVLHHIDTLKKIDLKLKQSHSYLEASLEFVGIMGAPSLTQYLDFASQVLINLDNKIKQRATSCELEPAAPPPSPITSNSSPMI